MRDLSSHPRDKESKKAKRENEKGLNQGLNWELLEAVVELREIFIDVNCTDCLRRVMDRVEEFT